MFRKKEENQSAEDKEATGNLTSVTRLINEKVAIINDYLNKGIHSVEITKSRKKKEQFISENAAIQTAKLAINIYQEVVNVKQQLQETKANQENKNQPREDFEEQNKPEFFLQQISANNAEILKIEEEEQKEQQLHKQSYYQECERIITSFKSEKGQRLSAQQNDVRQSIAVAPYFSSTKSNLGGEYRAKDNINYSTALKNCDLPLIDKSQIIINEKKRILDQNNSKILNTQGDSQSAVIMPDVPSDINQEKEKKKKVVFDNNPHYGFALVSSEDQKSIPISQAALVTPLVSPLVSRDAKTANIKEQTKNEFEVVAKIKKDKTAIRIAKRVNNYVAVIDKIPKEKRAFASLRTKWKSSGWSKARTPLGLWMIILRLISFPIEQFGIIFSITLRIRLFYFLVRAILSIEFIRSWCIVYCAFFSRDVPQMITDYQMDQAEIVKKNDKKESAHKSRKSFYNQFVSPTYNFIAFNKAFNNCWKKPTEKEQKKSEMISGVRLLHIGGKKVSSLFSKGVLSVVKLFIL